MNIARQRIKRSANALTWGLSDMGGRQADLASVGIDAELNPLVGRMASRLVKTFSPTYRGGDGARWELITEVLGFAAEAEQLLGEQRERIHQLESLTMTDELTGIGNRRGLEDFLKRALANAARHGEKGVVAFFDLDGFKNINDVYGHEVGDGVLCAVAEMFMAHVRVSDYVARLGGDEFVIVLTHCTAENGHRRALDLQRLLHEMTVSHAGHAIALRSSVGIAVYEKRIPIADLLRLADEEMYREKMAHRAAGISNRLAS